MYVKIDRSTVPAGVVFDVLPQDQGQIVEVAYGTMRRSGVVGDGSDPYKRVIDQSEDPGSAERVTYYKRAR